MTKQFVGFFLLAFSLNSYGWDEFGDLDEPFEIKDKTDLENNVSYRDYLQIMNTNAKRKWLDLTESEDFQDFCSALQDKAFMGKEEIDVVPRHHWGALAQALLKQEDNFSIRDFKQAAKEEIKNLHGNSISIYSNRFLKRLAAVAALRILKKGRYQKEKGNNIIQFIEEHLDSIIRDCEIHECSRMPHKRQKWAQDAG